MTGKRRDLRGLIGSVAPEPATADPGPVAVPEPDAPASVAPAPDAPGPPALVPPARRTRKPRPAPVPPAPVEPYREVKLSVLLSSTDHRELKAWADGARDLAGRKALPLTDVMRALARELVRDPNGPLAAAVIERLRR